MSLNWNVSKIANHKELCYAGERLNPITEALIWHCLALGLKGIDAKNVEEFFLRAEFHAKVFGAPLRWLAHERGQKDIERNFTLADIKAHIGLATNVTNETRKAWFKRITEHWFRDQEYKLHRSAHQEEQPAQA